MQYLSVSISSKFNTICQALPMHVLNYAVFIYSIKTSCSQIIKNKRIRKIKSI